MHDAGRDASRVRDVSTKHGMVQIAAEKVHWPVVDRRQQVEFSQLGQQRGVSDGVERLGKVSEMTTTKGLSCSRLITV